ncbi:ORF6N domain-containing protein [Algoriphagus sp. NG3]|uniref:ORF6N domain-containing protein n=1 Tax=Algoriphagus sp. NG3 TaxID=3097546 RepID=UPI002A816745|nr:ORF6N domain-containing protein [Algoriphagus sp. NG3]WPR76709.1 ORF6N domain-containing protein [Algoriphagus sp. NG3]
MDKDFSLSSKQIENRIFSIRGVQAMLDSHLAEIYNVTTGRLNEQVKRNSERFPEDFMFQLTQVEWDNLIAQHAKSNLRSQNAILENERGKHRKYLPYVFTEQGVAGLSGVLKSETASKVHVAIMRAFVAMRKLIQENQLIYDRLDRLELKQLETYQQFEQVFKALESKELTPNQGVFL